MMKKILLPLLPILLMASQTTDITKKIERIEKELNSLKKEVKFHQEDLDERIPIIESVEKKSILDKINFSPELRLRLDKYKYTNKMIGNNQGYENTQVYNNQNPPIATGSRRYDEEEELEKIHKDDIECHKKLIIAIDNDEILSFYQPIVPLQDNNLPMKYESLIRIKSNGVIIPPFRFIDVAKTNRIYHKLTKAIIKNTLSIISKYNIACSINISLVDINNERTMKHFFNIIESYEHNDLLTIELLETEDFDNYEIVYDFCMKVRSYGIKIALDDFGSGYANFSHILNLPVDYIKIDASLISDIDRNHNSRIMVETIVDLAKKLHVLTIAEFVSSQEILEVVTELGVDYAQGFHLGRPEEISKYMK